jgi:putative selenium metabolism hydrolase
MTPQPAVPASLAQAAARVRESAESLAQAQTEFLADLIRHRSYTGEEGPAVERTLDEMRMHGLGEVRASSAGDALATFGDGEYGLLYDAHLDHVDIGDEAAWPYPPLEPTIVDGTLFGIGASDDKGAIASMVYGGAMASALDLTGDCTVTLMGATMEEDAEGFAQRHLMEEDGFPTPDAVIIAEASDLVLRRGHRGRCEIRVRVPGEAAHASTPELGSSAILAMRPVIDAIDAMSPSLPIDSVLGQTTQVITQIESPPTPNSTPSWCEVTIDRRITPGETTESILADIGDVVGPLGGTARVPTQTQRAWTGIDVSGPAYFPGWLLEEDDLLVEAGRLTGAALWGKAPEVGIWPFSTNGTYYGGIAGIPTLGYGGMEEKYCHTPQDQVDLGMLLKGTMFYALFPLAYSHMRQA